MKGASLLYRVERITGSVKKQNTWLNSLQTDNQQTNKGFVCSFLLLDWSAYEVSITNFSYSHLFMFIKKTVFFVSWSWIEFILDLNLFFFDRISLSFFKIQIWIFGSKFKSIYKYFDQVQN